MRARTSASQASGSTSFNLAATILPSSPPPPYPPPPPRRSGRRPPGAFAWARAAGLRGERAQDEAGPRGITPAAPYTHGPRLRVGPVQLVVSAIGIGLENPGVAGQMPLGVFTAAIARVIEHRRRRVRPRPPPAVAPPKPPTPPAGLCPGHKQHRCVRPRPSRRPQRLR